MYPKNFLLLVTSTTLFNKKILSQNYYYSPIRHFISPSFKSYKNLNFNNNNNNFYFKRKFTTTTIINNLENVGKTFVYQPSSSNNPEHIHNISKVYPATYDDDSFQNNDDNDDKPSLMILIGWWNCKPKYLLKYISLYTNNFHIDTLSHIPPFYHVFFPWTIPRDINRLAKELIIMWIERGKPKNIGFHVFSNNGTYHYALLCEAVRNISKNYLDDKDKKNISSSTGFNISSNDAESFLNSIKSCVIDSAPSPITERYLALGIMGVMESFLNKPLIEKSKSNNISDNDEVSYPLIPILSIFFTLPIIKKYQDSAHKSLYNIPGGINDGRNIKYLFLYGPDDKIVTEKNIIEFISKLKEREMGALKIVEKRFGAGSGHVKHFLAYPNEYIDALKSFYNIK